MNENAKNRVPTGIDSEDDISNCTDQDLEEQIRNLLHNEKPKKKKYIFEVPDHRPTIFRPSMVHRALQKHKQFIASTPANQKHRLDFFSDTSCSPITGLSGNSVENRQEPENIDNAEIYSNNKDENHLQSSKRHKSEAEVPSVNKSHDLRNVTLRKSPSRNINGTLNKLGTPDKNNESSVIVILSEDSLKNCINKTTENKYLQKLRSNSKKLALSTEASANSLVKNKSSQRTKNSSLKYLEVNVPKNDLIGENKSRIMTPKDDKNASVIAKGHISRNEKTTSEVLRAKENTKENDLTKEEKSTRTSRTNSSKCQNITPKGVTNEEKLRVPSVEEVNNQSTRKSKNSLKRQNIASKGVTNEEKLSIQHVEEVDNQFTSKLTLNSSTDEHVTTPSEKILKEKSITANNRSTTINSSKHQNVVTPKEGLNEEILKEKASPAENKSKKINLSSQQNAITPKTIINEETMKDVDVLMQQTVTTPRKVINTSKHQKSTTQKEVNFANGPKINKPIKALKQKPSTAVQTENTGSRIPVFGNKLKSIKNNLQSQYEKTYENKSTHTSMDYNKKSSSDYVDSSDDENDNTLHNKCHLSPKRLGPTSEVTTKKRRLSNIIDKLSTKFSQVDREIQTSAQNLNGEQPQSFSGDSSGSYNIKEMECVSGTGINIYDSIKQTEMDPFSYSFDDNFLENAHAPWRIQCTSNLSDKLAQFSFKRFSNSWTGSGLSYTGQNRRSVKKYQRATKSVYLKESVRSANKDIIQKSHKKDLKATLNDSTSSDSSVLEPSQQKDLNSEDEETNSNIERWLADVVSDCYNEAGETNNEKTNGEILDEDIGDITPRERINEEIEEREEEINSNKDVKNTDQDIVNKDEDDIISERINKEIEEREKETENVIEKINNEIENDQLEDIVDKKVIGNSTNHFDKSLRVCIGKKDLGKQRIRRNPVDRKKKKVRAAKFSLPHEELDEAINQDPILSSIPTEEDPLVEERSLADVNSFPNGTAGETSMNEDEDDIKRQRCSERIEIRKKENKKMNDIVDSSDKSIVNMKNHLDKSLRVLIDHIQKSENRTEKGEEKIRRKPADRKKKKVCEAKSLLPHKEVDERGINEDPAISSIAALEEPIVEAPIRTAKPRQHGSVQKVSAKTSKRNQEDQPIIEVTSRRPVRERRPPTKGVYDILYIDNPSAQYLLQILNIPKSKKSTPANKSTTAKKSTTSKKSTSKEPGGITKAKHRLKKIDENSEIRFLDSGQLETINKRKTRNSRITKSSSTHVTATEKKTEGKSAKSKSRVNPETGNKRNRVRSSSVNSENFLKNNVTVIDACDMSQNFDEVLRNSCELPEKDIPENPEINNSYNTMTSNNGNNVARSEKPQDSDLFLKPGTSRDIDRDSGTGTLNSGISTLRSFLPESTSKGKRGRPKKPPRKSTDYIDDEYIDLHSATGPSKLNVVEGRENDSGRHFVLKVWFFSTILQEIEYIQKDSTFTEMEDGLKYSQPLEYPPNRTLIFLQLPPGSVKTLHVSKRHDLFYMVVEGEGRIFITDKVSTIKKFNSVIVPRGSAYCIKNDQQFEDMFLACVREKV